MTSASVVVAAKLEEADIALTATVKMVRLVSLVSPFIVVTLVSASIVVTLVFSFIVVTLAVFRCPEGSMFRDVGGRRRIADHLAAVVDAGSYAEAATG